MQDNTRNIAANAAALPRFSQLNADQTRTYIKHETAKQGYVQTMRFAAIVTLFISTALTTVGLAHAAQGDGTADQLDKAFEYTEFSIWAVFTVLACILAYRYFREELACRRILEPDEPIADTFWNVVSTFWDEGAEACGSPKFAKLFKPVKPAYEFLWTNPWAIAVEVPIAVSCITVASLALEGDITLRADDTENTLAACALLIVAVMATICAVKLAHDCKNDPDAIPDSLKCFLDSIGALGRALLDCIQEIAEFCCSVISSACEAVLEFTRLLPYMLAMIAAFALALAAAAGLFYLVYLINTSSPNMPDGLATMLLFLVFIGVPAILAGVTVFASNRLQQNWDEGGRCCLP